MENIGNRRHWSQENRRERSQNLITFTILNVHFRNSDLVDVSPRQKCNEQVISIRKKNHFIDVTRLTIVSIMPRYTHTWRCYRGCSKSCIVWSNEHGAESIDGSANNERSIKLILTREMVLQLLWRLLNHSHHLIASASLRESRN